MEQLQFLEPNNLEIELKIMQLEASMGKMQRSLYAKMGAMAKDYEFLVQNLEVVKDFVEVARTMMEGKNG
jgi:hypothetical protein